MEIESLPGIPVGLEVAARLLAQGQVELVGQILASSNVIFLASVTDEALEALAIYKPFRGERPLWDFGRGTLGRREVAAYTVSQALGWPNIPPVVLRDGPHGRGAFQLYIDADPESTYFSLGKERLPDLLPVVLFDLITNNADRKGGHLLLDRWSRVWAIDNALTFHTEPKLRTVIWDFAGEPVPEERLADVRKLDRCLAGRGSMQSTLTGLLAGAEITALRDRLAALLKAPVFPHPSPNRRQVPWPLI